jgi:hypothetical protein
LRWLWTCLHGSSRTDVFLCRCSTFPVEDKNLMALTLLDPKTALIEAGSTQNVLDLLATRSA